MPVTPTVLSPIAITVRDQTTPAVRSLDLPRVRAVCSDVLEANTIGIELGSAEMKSVVGSVVQGVLAALATTRAEVIERAMNTIARFASTRKSSDPTVVAAVICDAASVIEVSVGDRKSHLASMIDSVLAACDHLLGAEREELATFLRATLPTFLEKGLDGTSDKVSSA